MSVDPSFLLMIYIENHTFIRHVATMRIKAAFAYDSEFGKAINARLKEEGLKSFRVKKEKYRSMLCYYRPPSKKRKRGSDIDNDASHPGDKCLDLIFEKLNTLHRSSQQKIFHKTMLASFLRIIYGKSYDAEKHRVMTKYGFESRKQQVIICAPRRMGKTFAVALIMVVMVIVMPEIEISIFSPGKRQSVALMGVIVEFMNKLGEGERIIQRNEEKMRVRSLDGRVSKLNAYPSAVRTLKGVSGTICVLEEMAQIDPSVLYEVICPLHQLDVTSIIGISTITDENNFMTKYLKQKDTHGEPLFATKHIYLACEDCRAKGIPSKCNHNKHLLPAWSSERKGMVVKSIMKGQEEMIAREVGGQASTLHQRAFPMKFVRRYSDLPPVNLPYDQTYDFMFHAIDPAAAGKSSDIAITSLIRKGGQYIIIGLEAFPCKTAMENHSLILEHIFKLREDPRFSNALSVFILENNMGMESDHIADMLKSNTGNFLVMNERDDGIHTGFRTTNTMKTIAVEAIRELIMNDAIRLSDDDTIVSVSRSVVDSRNMLEEQLIEFREMLQESHNGTGQPKKFYSGKMAGKDDLVMSLMLNIHWSGYLYKNPKYEHYIS